MIDPYLVFFFVLGAIVASFVHVVVLRLHTGRSILTGRSVCDSCGEPLSWYHLIPIISFVHLFGRCGMCGSKIGISHVFVEIVFALLFLWVYMMFGLSISLVFALLFIVLCGAIVLYDIRHTIIPNEFVYPLIILGALHAYISSGFLYTVIAAASMAALFALIWLVSRGRAMGFGDAKLVFGLALFVGYPISLSGFLLSFWGGAVISILLLVFQGKRRTMSHEVPFAPYLVLGFLCAYLFDLTLIPLLLL